MTNAASTQRHRADHLLTMDGEVALIADGVVDVSDGRVTWSGPAADAPPFDGTVARHRGLLMPGFVNTHAHTPMVLLRGSGEGLPVDRWLHEVMWPREGRLTGEDVRWGMTLGAGELLRNGITTSHESYFLGESIAEAAVAVGYRAVVTPPLLTGEALTRFGTWEHQLEGIGALAARFADHPLVSIGIGPHAAYSLDEEPLQAVADLAAETGLHVHIHVAEGQHEDRGIRDRYAMSVPRYLDRLGMFRSHVVIAHGIWLDDDDIALLARHGAGVAHCPVSNGKHASGICRVTDLRGAGIPVGIATDGPVSHDQLDLFEEMRTAIRYARLRTLDADALGASDALVMATREAARVLGRTDIGTLATGSHADMILVDTSELGPVIDDHDLVTHLVFSGTPSLIRSVWVGGRHMVEDGTPLTINMHEARAEVNARARRLTEET